jgi:hypothetical protein
MGRPTDRDVRPAEGGCRPIEFARFQLSGNAFIVPEALPVSFRLNDAKLEAQLLLELPMSCGAMRGTFVAGGRGAPQEKKEDRCEDRFHRPVFGTLPHFTSPAVPTD